VHSVKLFPPSGSFIILVSNRDGRAPSQHAILTIRVNSAWRFCRGYRLAQISASEVTTVWRCIKYYQSSLLILGHLIEKFSLIVLIRLVCPAPNKRSIKRCFCLTSVSLSVCRVSREQRGQGRKTKIGTEVAHVTRDSDTTFKIKRSKVKVTTPLWLVVLAGQHGHTVMVTYLYAYVTYIMSPLAGLCGGISWRPPAYSWLL